MSPRFVDLILVALCLLSPNCHYVFAVETAGDNGATRDTGAVAPADPGAQKSLQTGVAASPEGSADGIPGVVNLDAVIAKKQAEDEDSVKPVHEDVTSSAKTPLAPEVYPNPSTTATMTTTTTTTHYGTKPGHFGTSYIHFPTSEGVSERANE